MTDGHPREVAAEPEEFEGGGLINTSFAGTGATLVAGAAGAASPDALGTVTAAVAGVCFLAGVVAFLWGYANGVVRSRDEQVTLGGLFFLTGTAPGVVRFRMRLAFGLQCLVAVIAAALRPYTAVAFIVLAPMLGLGLMAAWGARHGTFFPKDDRR